MDKESILDKCMSIDDGTNEGMLIANWIRSNIDDIMDFLEEI